MIINIADTLQKHKTLKYTTRQLSRIAGIVVHHTTGPVTSSGTAPPAIARYHVDNLGWPGIGYHFFIDVDGKIYQTNHLETVSYHAGNPNTATIGIVLRGDFTSVQPTAAQKASLVDLLRYLRNQKEFEITQIAGHGQYPGATPSSCPGKTWPQWLPQAIEASAIGGTPVPQPEPMQPQPASLTLKVLTGCNIRKEPVIKPDNVTGWRSTGDKVDAIALRVISPSSVWVQDGKGWSAVVHNGIRYMDGA